MCYSARSWKRRIGSSRFAMESQYNQLLSTSKTVGAFYEDVYAPVLQTLPWIDTGDGLNTASEKVLGNLAFPAYELSSYKNQTDENLIEHLRARRSELESIYQKMQDELRPLIAKMPVKDQTWEKLQEMVPKWKNLSSSDLLPYNIHKAVEEFYASSNPIQSSDMTGRSSTSPDVSTSVLGKLMADEIKSLHKKRRKRSYNCLGIWHSWVLVRQRLR